METNPSTTPSSAATTQLPPRRINWLVFLAAMFVPTLLTIVTILLGAKEGDTAPTVAALCGGISGVLCGTMLARRFGRTRELRIVLGIVFALVMGGACVAMNCFGASPADTT